MGTESVLYYSSSILTQKEKLQLHLLTVRTRFYNEEVTFFHEGSVPFTFE